MLTLYHNDMSSCAQKVRIALAEKDVAWKGIHLSLRKGEARTDDYKRLNPNGVVPTLITEEDEVIIESTIILEYIDDACPGVPLRPAEPAARARMRMWSRQLDEGIHADLATVCNAVAFRYQHMEGRTPAQVDAHMDRIPDPVRRARSKDLVANGIGSEFFAPAIRNFDALFMDMETALGRGQWLAGEDYSLADIALVPYVTRMDHLHFSPMWRDRPRLKNWYDTMRALPAYEVGIGTWLNDEYLDLMASKGRLAWPHVEKVLTGASGHP